MKKFFSMMLLFTAMFLTFSACSNDEDDFDYPMDTLYGTWEGIAMNHEGNWVDITEYPYTKLAFTIKFNSDGTYTGKGYFGNGSGTYTAKGKTIITYVNGKEYLRYDIKSLTNNVAELSMTVDGSGESIIVKVRKK